MTRPACPGRRAFLATALFAPLAGAAVSRPARRLAIGVLGDGPLAEECERVGEIHPRPPRFLPIAEASRILPGDLDGLVVTLPSLPLLQDALAVRMPVCMPLPDVAQAGWDAVCTGSDMFPVQFIFGAGAGDWPGALDERRSRLPGPVRHAHHGHSESDGAGDWIARHMALTALAGSDRILRASAFPGTDCPSLATLACQDGSTLTIGLSPAGIAPRTVLRTVTGSTAWDTLPRPTPLWLLAEWLDALRTGESCTMSPARARHAADALALARAAAGMA